VSTKIYAKFNCLSGKKDFIFSPIYAMLETIEKLSWLRKVLRDFIAIGNGGFNTRRVEMTKAETQVLETDAILFPPRIKQEILIADVKSESSEVRKTRLKTDIKIRFARLKKSMRKRSAGIL
jgi:phage tail sheath gpL-like